MVAMIDSFFDNYISNYVNARAYDEALKSTQDKALWVQNLKERSSGARDLYAANTKMIAEMETFLSERKAGAELTGEEAEALYNGVMRMYFEDCDDFHVVPMLLAPVIAYFTKHEDVEKRINLHAVSCYHKIEVRNRLMNDVTMEDIMEDTTYILEHKQLYPQLSVDVRRRIFTTYYNLIIVCLDADMIPIETSYNYLQEMLAFWNSSLVQELDGQDDNFIALIERTRKSWLGFNYQALNASDEVLRYYMKLSDEYYRKDNAEGRKLRDFTHEVYVSHIFSRCMRMQMDWEKGFDKFTEYYAKRRDFFRKNRVENTGKLIEMSYEYMDYLYFFINLPQSVIQWIIDYNIPKKQYVPYVQGYLKDLEEIWDELYINLPGTYLDNFVVKVCMFFISQINSSEEQEEWINKMVIKRDLTTEIHSTMVSNIALEIAKAMLTDCPEVFEGTWGLRAEDIIQNKEKILLFIEKAACFHDIGKTRIGDVINTQTRRLNDLEFKVIQTHPKHGYDLARLTDIIKKYSDVILGHHRFYDGSKGYPVDFDNTKSRVRPIIDLITISDCIDAATDILGRNYAHGKDYSRVIQEIYAERGTRYNMSMAEYLFKNQELGSILTELTSEGRIEVYYKIYEDYFK